MIKFGPTHSRVRGRWQQRGAAHAQGGAALAARRGFASAWMSDHFFWDAFGGVSIPTWKAGRP
jgi:alkanesulfonate monooxygenase SsuD/methylene tetrahydromethanopterin reductase-like flavin-dependent oxidoreductase (luciferase family)